MTMRATDAAHWDDLPLEIWMETARRLADRHPAAFWFEEGDRHSIAYLGLLRAQRTWRPGCGNRPFSWLYRCVWGELMEECSGPRYRHKHITLDPDKQDRMPDLQQGDVASRVLERQTARERLRTVYLSPAERNVMILIADGWTAPEIGRALGISTQRVFQSAVAVRKRARGCG